MNPTRLAEIRATQARADALVAAAQTDATDMSWVIANVDAIADVQAEQVRAVPELLAEIDALRGALQPFAAIFDAWLNREGNETLFLAWLYHNIEIGNMTLRRNFEAAYDALKGGE